MLMIICRKIDQTQSSRPRLSKGFTVIEIVISITLIGILSAVAISRFLDSGTYDPVIARDQIISLSRAAQQNALGRNDIQLSITPSGNNLSIEITDSTGSIQSAQFSSRNVNFSGDVNELDSCATTAGANTITVGTPFVIRFDSLGNLLEGGVTSMSAITHGARVCINNDPVMSVCFSAAGYAYAGDCVD